MAEINWSAFNRVVSIRGSIIITHSDIEIAESIAFSPDGKTAFDREGQATCPWEIRTVVKRATKGYDNEFFSSNASNAVTSKKNFSPTDNTFPKYVVIGYSRTGDGPVYMKCPRATNPPKDSSTRSRAAGDAPRDKNSLNGNEFRLLRKGGKVHVDAIIPHILITIPDNLIALKQATWTPGVDVTSTRISESYQGTQAELLDTIQQQAYRLEHGTALRPIAMYQAISLSPAISSGGEDPIQEDFIPRWDILLRDSGDTRGFKLRLHLVLLKNYDPKLIRMLEGFALSHPHDILPIPLLLQASEVYNDIMASENRQIEEVFDQGDSTKYPLPICEFSRFAVYFGHYLRHTEYNGLSDYIHPFRFISRMSEKDLNPSERLMDPMMHIQNLDFNIVRELLSESTAKIPSIPVDYKIRVFPFMMPGTKLPPLQFRANETQPITVPDEVAIELSGIGSIYSFGQPSYAPTSESQVRIAIPRPIAMSMFHKEPSDQRPLQSTENESIVQDKVSMCNPEGDGVTFLGAADELLQNNCCGPVWKINSDRVNEDAFKAPVDTNDHFSALPDSTPPNDILLDLTDEQIITDTEFWANADSQSPDAALPDNSTIDDATNNAYLLNDSSMLDISDDKSTSHDSQTDDDADGDRDHDMHDDRDDDQRDQNHDGKGHDMEGDNGEKAASTKAKPGEPMHIDFSFEAREKGKLLLHSTSSNASSSSENMTDAPPYHATLHNELTSANDTEESGIRDGAQSLKSSDLLMADSTLSAHYKPDPDTSETTQGEDPLSQDVVNEPTPHSPTPSSDFRLTNYHKISYNPIHPDEISYFGKMGDMFRNMGSLDTYCERSRAIARRTMAYPDWPPNMYQCVNSCGVTYTPRFDPASPYLSELEYECLLDMLMTPIKHSIWKQTAVQLQSRYPLERPPSLTDALRILNESLKVAQIDERNIKSLVSADTWKNANTLTFFSWLPSSACRMIGHHVEDDGKIALQTLKEVTTDVFQWTNQIVIMGFSFFAKECKVDEQAKRFFDMYIQYMAAHARLHLDIEDLMQHIQRRISNLPS
ncbi:hypothetical protein V8C40DRAFT_279094 [Trichoderma camerunense]